jgi:hypothetical protein
MEFTRAEEKALEQVAKDNANEVVELVELDLIRVGGGYGEITF